MRFDASALVRFWSNASGSPASSLSVEAGAWAPVIGSSPDTHSSGSFSVLVGGFGLLFAGNALFGDGEGNLTVAKKTRTYVIDPIAPGTSIGHVHLKVSDLNRAVEFYRHVLGFDVMPAMRPPG